ncbi:MAG: YeaH/YhbH family protein [Planctomycetota bacterium]
MFIDRRRNPKSKNLGNRGRFLRRVRSHVRRAVDEAIKGRKIADIDSGQEVTIDPADVTEPIFGHQNDVGDRQYVLPGNRGYQRGDRILRPKSGEDGSGQGGSPDGDSQDDFTFVLSRDEFLDLFFEDLQLPNLAKKKLRSIDNPVTVRAGYSCDGSPQRLNLSETMRRSLARRIALGRPKGRDLEAMEKELEELDSESDEAQELRGRIEIAQKRMRQVPFLDTVDLRYNHFTTQPRPTSQAVMFCLMDTSASMTEDLKSLAKRFYILLHLFLARHYQYVELVFVRHTYTAAEVDEETFFHGTDSGGTVVSSALEVMSQIVRNRYPVADWNIYAAQASDGHNFDHDMPRTMSLLLNDILPICQYYAYIEVGDYVLPGDSLLWQGYESIDDSDCFQMAQVTEASEIFPVFRKLFATQRRGSSAAAAERNGAIG